MNRDAKIGIVVILIIVVVLVIIWGRADEPLPEDTSRAEETQGAGLGDNSLFGDSGSSDTAGMNDDTLTSDPYETSASSPYDSADDNPGETGAVDFTAESPPTPPVVPPEPETRTYTVKEGDTLGKIASEQLGDRTRWEEIAKLNNLDSPDLIRVGQKLKMPGRGAVSSTASATAPPTPTGGQRTYVVQDGDSLLLIAEEQLGDRGKWKQIAELNQLAKPDDIKVGQKLLLPE